MPNQHYRQAGAAGVVCLAALLLSACNATDGLIATVTQPIHPVLIRNDQNVMLQLVIDSKRTSPARLESL